MMKVVGNQNMKKWQKNSEEFIYKQWTHNSIKSHHWSRRLDYNEVKIYIYIYIYIYIISKLPGMGGEEIKKMMEGVNSTLINCKNFCVTIYF
jgi:hypothetical protein